MLNMLNRYREELNVAALPPEPRERGYGGASGGSSPLRTSPQNRALQADIVIRNKNGHKLPTAYPSRRVWLHCSPRPRRPQRFRIRCSQPDGSIVGNDNTPTLRFEPTTPKSAADQVEIYESIIGDENGHVTTGLLTGVRYLKDNRLLPDGFDKQTPIRTSR
jgi:hypothetical protein